ncbi:MAG: TIM barrel protein [Agriterribacter sp.]
MNIGFSTGSLALGDFRRAISMQDGCGANSIELSALREDELFELLGALDSLNLQSFKYVSFHAPSKLFRLSEKDLIRFLRGVYDRGYNIIVHPDLIEDFEEWRVFGSLLCIENMDKRKAIGQTALDLQNIFEKLPEASLCFDIAHAKQIDPTMLEALSIASIFHSRISEIHISDVNSNSQHEPLNLGSVIAFRKLRRYLDINTPLIIESPVNLDEIPRELEMISCIFDDKKFESLMNSWGLEFNAATKLVSSH